MKKIAVFTGTRAEYGLLRWLMHDIQASEEFALQVIVSGAHLSRRHGETWREIIADGFEIDARIDMLLASDSATGVVKSMGVGLIGFADALTRLKPDAIVVLGDRYEALAMAQAALILKVPIMHLHGGELSEGAYDDAIRHAITKLSHWHFVAAEEYRRRVVQMGEAPERVFNVGAIGLDGIRRTPRMSLEELSESLGFALRRPYFLVTYNPVTLMEEPPAETFAQLLDALDAFPEHQVILTYPNADNGGVEIIQALEAYASGQPERILAIPSLGSRRYLSAMSQAAAVIGNSSSALIEAPALRVPSINMGVRQQGRLSADSVIHCATSTADIRSAIEKALSSAFLALCADAKNPYGDGQVAQAIVEIMRDQDFSAYKHFHDLDDQ